MTKISSLLTIVLCSGFAFGCATEEGYTPIGEDREDKGGGHFYLSAENPSGTVYFSCDSSGACDLELSIALEESTPDAATMSGLEVLHSTLLSPTGDDRAESLIVGDDLAGTDVPTWDFVYLAIPAGDYSIALDLGALDGASVQVRTTEL